MGLSWVKSNWLLYENSPFPDWNSVLAVEMSEILREELRIKIDRTTFFTDSKVVLGYISNQNRRFHIYVNNRVQRIKLSFLPDQ